MTAAVYRGTPSLNIPQTQNTAPVLEFSCLYTHDIRRKQKRWQDGFLRYHTFNKRVMVYDVPRNFIGDAHWTADAELQEGDELRLEKGGVMVEVAEAVGRTETDLTELRKSKNKGSSERGSSPPARGPQTPAPAARMMVGMASKTPAHSTAARQPTQLKHRSLNALLGTPKGPIGKAALPAKSPFELRHTDVENEQWEQGRPPKRQRGEHWKAPDHVAAKSVITPLWARTTDAIEHKKKAPLQARQQRTRPREVIDLLDVEPEPIRFLPGFSSDTLVAPSSPPREQVPARKHQPSIRSSSPAFQTQKAPETCAVTTKQRSLGDKVPAATEGQGISHDRSHKRTTIANLPELPDDRYAQDSRLNLQAGDASLQRLARQAAKERSVGSTTGSTLRMSGKAPKKTTLACQDQLVTKPSRVSSTNTEAAADRLLGAAVDGNGQQPRPKTQRQLLEERLGRIEEKKRAKAEAERRIEQSNSADMARKQEVAMDRAMMAAEAQMEDVQQQLEPDDTIRLDDAALPDDVDHTDIEISNELGPASRKPQTSPQPKTKEPMALVEAPILISTLPTVIMPVPTPVRQKFGVSRKDIRASALSCYQKPSNIQKTAPPPPAEPKPPPPEPELPIPETEERRQLHSKVSPPAAPNPVPPPPPPPRKEDRQFRRVVSDMSGTTTSYKPKRIPGAPMRLTPSPSKLLQQQQPFVPPEHKKLTNNTHPKQQIAPPPKAWAKKQPFQRAVSLNTAASGTTAVLLGRAFQPPAAAAAAVGGKMEAVGAGTVVEEAVAAPADPWSREAYDLFVWRPPGWDEEKWAFVGAKAGGGGASAGG